MADSQHLFPGLYHTHSIHLPTEKGPVRCLPRAGASPGQGRGCWGKQGQFLGPISLRRAQVVGQLPGYYWLRLVP